MGQRVVAAPTASFAPLNRTSIRSRETDTPSGKLGLFAGGGEILRLARPRVTVLRLRMRGPSGPAPAAGSDHRLWETAVLFHLRDAFRAGDVWLARSRRYGDIRKALLSAPAVADADHSLPAPASPHDWLAERRFALDKGLRRLAAAGGGPVRSLAEASKTAVLRVERTETAVPDGAADLESPTSTGGCPRRGRANSWPTFSPLGWEHINLTGGIPLAGRRPVGHRETA